MTNKINNNINIFIPKIDKELSISKLHNIITSIFKENCINRINIIYNKKINSNMVYIYFYYWPDNKISMSIKNKLLNNETIKIVYNYPNYFKCILKK